MAGKSNAELPSAGLLLRRLAVLLMTQLSYMSSCRVRDPTAYAGVRGSVRSKEGARGDPLLPALSSQPSHNCISDDLP